MTTLVIMQYEKYLQSDKIFVTPLSKIKFFLWEARGNYEGAKYELYAYMNTDAYDCLKVKGIVGENECISTVVPQPRDKIIEISKLIFNIRPTKGE